MKVIVLLVLIGLTIADIPVHCVKHQVLGKWKLQVSEPILKGRGQVPCGHSIPDNAGSSFRAGSDFRAKESFEVTLGADYSSDDGKTRGSWTMVYDEGFEINHKNVKYFAFSKYEPNSGGYKSYCGETLVGWYNNEVTQERGCYRAERVDSKVDSSDSYDMISVVQPEFVQMTTAHKISKDATNHKEIVDHINSKSNKWHAKAHKQFEGKSIEELNQMAGRKKYHQEKGRKSASFAQITKSDVSDLPKSFNHRQYLAEPRQQKQCGSCYAIATMEMLSARLRMKGEDVTLSPQYSVDCNYYNQGCDGGYPFLVEKFATEQFLATEEQYPYKGETGQCKKVEASNKAYSVGQYRYIGGGYGLSNERDIMMELYHNGPVILNFEPGYDFMYYNGGIYHSSAESDVHAEWEKVDHSVLCYGWGEENGEKFWMLQNSWGSQWGEEGNFRMRRGVDESAIESMAEAADPVVLTKNPHGEFVEMKKGSTIFVEQTSNLRKQ